MNSLSITDSLSVLDLLDNVTNTEENETLSGSFISPISEPHSADSKCLAIFFSILMILVTTTTFVGLGTYALFFCKPFPWIDESLDAFSIPKHKVSLNIDALFLAEKDTSKPQKTKRSIPEWSRKEKDNFIYTLFDHHEIYNHLQKRSKDFQEVHYQRIPRWKMQVVYIAKGDDKANIFTPERLEHIHSVELNIMSHPEFQKFCLKEKVYTDESMKTYGGCLPLNSLLSYFFPSMNEDGHIFYDGLGANIDMVDSAIRLAMNSDTFYYFVDDKINNTYLQSSFLRSEVLFGAPLQGYHSWQDRTIEQTEKFKKFIVTYINLLSASSNDKVQVLYGGNELFDYEVDHTFWNDMKLVWVSIFCIVLFILILTYSLWFTIVGLLSILISFPLAFFFYRVVFGKKAVGILTGASVFLLIGIGVDDVFVFVNIFRQSSSMTNLKSRMLYTVETAGKATFFTSFTTAAAFAANIASYIPAIHDFGLFMFLLVSCCWLAIVLLIPPSLYLWSISCSHCEVFTFRWSQIYRCKDLQLPDDLFQFTNQRSRNCTDEISSLTQNDEHNHDVPLLSMEGSSLIDNTTVDDVLLSSSTTDIHENLVNSEEGLEENQEHQKQMPFSVLLQGLLYHYVARPVIYARYFIIVLFFIILCISAGIISTIQPASKPPQLFRSTTNLQRLLNLKANLSMEHRISCDDCSGLFKESPVKAPLSKDTSTSINKAHRTDESSVDMNTKLPKFLNNTTKGINSPRISNVNHEKQETESHHLQGSVEKNFDVCQSSHCENLKNRPSFGSGAVVYIVLGIKGLDQSNVTNEHVINFDKGTVIYDPEFQNAFGNFNKVNATLLVTLCKLCQLIAKNSKLVRNGTAQCLPDFMPDAFKIYLSAYPECQNLPGTIRVFGHQTPAPALAGLTKNKNGLQWIAFAFESTTSKSESYFTAYNQYAKWENFLEELKETVLKDAPPFQSILQVSRFWRKVLQEVILVSSAIYSLALSMVICIIATAIFTGHITFLFIVCVTILGIICFVVGVFCIFGWEIGSIEAVSLSILVGSSVDYCVHLVEGYLISGKKLKIIQSPSETRQWRTSAAITHIGVSIISSAITTVTAAIPLTYSTILPFSKFGWIIAINTSVAILFTLTVCPALLSTIAPAQFHKTWCSILRAVLITVTFVIVFVVILFGVSFAGIFIPGPDGEALFPQ